VAAHLLGGVADVFVLDHNDRYLDGTFPPKVEVVHAPTLLENRALCCPASASRVQRPDVVWEGELVDLLLSHRARYGTRWTR
jgi:hypothetical protein